MNNSSTPGALRSNRQREKNRVTNKSQLDIYNKVLSKIHLDVLVGKKRGGGERQVRKEVGKIRVTFTSYLKTTN